MFNWLSLITGFFYIVFGVLVILRKSFVVVALDSNVAYPLGAVLILYGIFRMVRAGIRLKNKD